MGFYYFSLFSWMAFFFYFFIAVAIILNMFQKSKLSNHWKAVLLVVAFIAPWTEEIWIAYNFGQLCRKDAGLFINKVVETEGFYSDSGASLELVRPGKYQYIEFPSRNGQAYSRLMAGDPEFMRAALEKYKHENAGVEISKRDYIRVKIDDRTEALVYPGKGDSWRITNIDLPTVRYRYVEPSIPAPASYKVNKWEYLITDTQTGETLARQTKYSRKPYWFFIQLDAPVMLCPAPGERPDEEQVGMLYNAVLKPIAAK